MDLDGNANDIRRGKTVRTAPDVHATAPPSRLASRALLLLAAAAALAGTAAPSTAGPGTPDPSGTILLQVEDFDGEWRRQGSPQGYLGAGCRTAHSSRSAATPLTHKVSIGRAGEYTVWLRAYVIPDGRARYAPAGVRMTVGGHDLARTHAAGPTGWSWQRAGKVPLAAGPVEIAVRDADIGREAVDAVLLTTRTTTADELAGSLDLFYHVAQAARAGRFLAACESGPIVEPVLGDTEAGAGGSVALVGAQLAHLLGGLRWLHNPSAKSNVPAGAGVVEFHNGDRLRGQVVGCLAGRSDAWGHVPTLLRVRPAAGKGDRPADPRANGQGDLLVRADWVRRIAFPGHALSEALPPRCLVFRDGRRESFDMLRWGPQTVSILTDRQARTAPLDELAEVHLPATDPWEQYYRELAELDPAATGRLVRFELAGGQVFTTSTHLLLLDEDRSGRPPGTWQYAIQPAWSARAVGVALNAVRRVWRFRGHEMPLGHLPPSKVAEQSSLGAPWTWRVDRNVAGGPLHSGGRVYGWGLGVHAACELTFPLPACARAFRSRIGLDRLAGGGGCVRARVLLQPGPDKPLWESKLLIGSARVSDTGAIRLDRPAADGAGAPAGKRSLVLVADAAHEDRPAGADPFDIRDHFDWLEPMLLLDPAKLRHLVADRVEEGLPAWRGWRGRGAGALPRTRWDPKAPGGARFVLEYPPEAAPRTLTAERTLSADDRWLYLKFRRRGAALKAGQVEVRIDGRTVARIDVPDTPSAAGPGDQGEPARPFLVPLKTWQGRRVRIEVAHKPGEQAERIEWLSLAVVPRPTRTHWTPLTVLDSRAWPGQAPVLQPDGSLLATGQSNAWGETYLLHLAGPAGQITALRLDALAHPSLPKGGPGRNVDGNFLLSRILVRTPATQRRPVRGRYVRLEALGSRRSLAVGEVQVFAAPPTEKAVLARWTRTGHPPGGPPGGPPAGEEMLALLRTPPARRTRGQAIRLRAWLDGLAENLAAGKRAAQSSVAGKYEAGKAVDGDTRHGFSHTEREEDPWWQVDLGAEREIDRIVVWNRPAYGYDKLTNFRLAVLDRRRQVRWQSERIADPPSPVVEVSDSDAKPLRISAVSASYCHAWGSGSLPDVLAPTVAGWTVGMRPGQSHVAVFTLAEPATVGHGGLIVELRHGYGGQWQNRGALGCLRLWATSDPPPIEAEPIPVEVPLLPPAPKRGANRGR